MLTTKIKPPFTIAETAELAAQETFTGALEDQTKLISEVLLRARRLRSILTGEPDKPFGAPPPMGLMGRAMYNREGIAAVLDELAAVERTLGDPERIEG